VTFSSAAVTTGTGNVSSSSGSGTNTITVNLANVSNAQTITVTLFGVVKVAGATPLGNIGVQMGVLLGDVSANGLVNSTDISQVQAQSGQPATGSNFRTDVTVNGLINSTDISTVQSKSGTGF
jgi:Dockerin type I domain